MSKYNLIAEACTKLTFPLKIAYTLRGIPTTEVVWKAGFA